MKANQLTIRQSDPLEVLSALSQEQINQLSLGDLNDATQVSLRQLNNLAEGDSPQAVLTAAKYFATEQLNQLLRRKVERDENGLFRRPDFMVRAVERLKQNRDTYCVILFDVRQMKLLNEKYKYDRVTKVLNYISLSIPISIRQNDLATRYGGDEFVLFTQSTPKALDNHLNTITKRVYRNVHQAASQGQIIRRFSPTWSKTAEDLEDLANAVMEVKYKVDCACCAYDPETNTVATYLFWNGKLVQQVKLIKFSIKPSEAGIGKLIDTCNAITQCAKAGSTPIALAKRQRDFAEIRSR